jgi:hypothetical protein
MDRSGVVRFGPFTFDPTRMVLAKEVEPHRSRVGPVTRICTVAGGTQPPPSGLARLSTSVTCASIHVVL